jgi:hypothetical protein
LVQRQQNQRSGRWQDHPALVAAAISEVATVNRLERGKERDVAAEMAAARRVASAEGDVRAGRAGREEESVRAGQAAGAAALRAPEMTVEQQVELVREAPAGVAGICASGGLERQPPQRQWQRQWPVAAALVAQEASQVAAAELEEGQNPVQTMAPPRRQAAAGLLPLQPGPFGDSHHRVSYPGAVAAVGTARAAAAAAAAGGTRSAVRRRATSGVGRLGLDLGPRTTAAAAAGAAAAPIDAAAPTAAADRPSVLYASPVRHVSVSVKVRRTSQGGAWGSGLHTETVKSFCCLCIAHLSYAS